MLPRLRSDTLATTALIVLLVTSGCSGGRGSVRSAATGPPVSALEFGRNLESAGYRNVSGAELYSYSGNRVGTDLTAAQLSADQEISTTPATQPVVGALIPPHLVAARQTSWAVWTPPVGDRSPAALVGGVTINGFANHDDAVAFDTWFNRYAANYGTGAGGVTYGAIGCGDFVIDGDASLLPRSGEMTVANGGTCGAAMPSAPGSHSSGLAAGAGASSPSSSKPGGVLPTGSAPVSSVWPSCCDRTLGRLFGDFVAIAADVVAASSDSDTSTVIAQLSTAMTDDTAVIGPLTAAIQLLNPSDPGVRPMNQLLSDVGRVGDFINTMIRDCASSLSSVACVSARSAGGAMKATVTGDEAALNSLPGVVLSPN